MKKKTILAVGELLWDLLPDRRLLGGAPANFVSRMNWLGNRAYIASRLGEDDPGHEARKVLAEHGLNLEFVQTDPEYATGTVHICFDEDRNPDCLIVPQVAYDFIELTDPLKELAGKADCIAFGSLAQRSERSAQTIQALLELGKKKIRFCDVNLRKNCYTRSIIERSLRAANIVKFNLEEISEMDRWFGSGNGVVEETCFRLSEQFCIDICLVTLEGYGALATDRDRHIYYSPGFEVRMADPLGAGDAFSAGFLHRFLRHPRIEEALEYGNQLGAYVVTQHGAMQPISMDAFTEYFRPQKNRLVHPGYGRFAIRPES